MSEEVGNALDGIEVCTRADSLIGENLGLLELLASDFFDLVRHVDSRQVDVLLREGRLVCLGMESVE